MKRHAASLVVVLAVLAGCGGGDAGSEPKTLVQISAWPQGKGEGEARNWTMRCDPDGGDLPDLRAACEKLDELDDPFARPPRDAICTEIYGGPAVAEITGTHDGDLVDAQFTRTDGCEIARWDQHAFLFPVKPGSP